MLTSESDTDQGAYICEQMGLEKKTQAVSKNIGTAHEGQRCQCNLGNVSGWQWPTLGMRTYLWAQVSERPSFRVKKPSRAISKMTALTAHLETSFSAHVNPVRRETVEADGFVSALTAVSLGHLQVKQSVKRVQQSIVQRLFSPRVISSNTSELCSCSEQSISNTLAVCQSISIHHQTES